jgi:Phosphoribosylanthranilate isomerase
MTRIKICGLFRTEDAGYVNEALPDYAGFVFAESRRRVTRSQAEKIRELLNPFVKAAGVFVNAPVEEIAALARDGVIDAIQLHGDEDAAYIEQLRRKTDAPVIRAVRVQNARQILEAQGLPCDYLLLDTWQKDGYGGSGKAFDWALILEIQTGSPEGKAFWGGHKPFFLAGGIDAANVREALKCRPYGIDVSSGAETDGVKDRDKIIELVRIVRSEDR